MDAKIQNIYIKKYIMNYTMKFGQFVRKRRLELGITQKELSLRISNKADIKFISQLELGIIENITLFRTEKILEALDSEMNFKVRETIIL